MTTTSRLWLLFILTVVLIAIAFITDPIAQSASFHLFGDTRKIAGIPNFWNVISNIPFLIIGVYGLIRIGRSKTSRAVTLIYTFLFIGILFTGLGSAYYHYHPDNESLVFDRLPMTIVFMSFLSATIFECINAKAGIRLLFPLLAIGVFSVLWWHYTESLGAGDLRIYLVVQFYPVIFIPLIIFLFPSADNKKVVWSFVWIVAWYIVAKILEHFDDEIYNSIRFISGHSLKHLAAAVSTWYIVGIFTRKYGHPVAPEKSLTKPDKPSVSR